MYIRNYGNVEGESYLLEMEVKGGHNAGGGRTATVVGPIQDAHVGSQDFKHRQTDK